MDRNRWLPWNFDINLDRSSQCCHSGVLAFTATLEFVDILLLIYSVARCFAVLGIRLPYLLPSQNYLIDLKYIVIRFTLHLVLKGQRYAYVSNNENKRIGTNYSCF